MRGVDVWSVRQCGALGAADLQRVGWIGLSAPKRSQPDVLLELVAVSVGIDKSG